MVKRADFCVGPDFLGREDFKFRFIREVRGMWGMRGGARGCAGLCPGPHQRELLKKFPLDSFQTFGSWVSGIGCLWIVGL